MDYYTSHVSDNMLLAHCDKIREDVHKDMYNKQLGKNAEMMFWHIQTNQPMFYDIAEEVKTQMGFIKNFIKNRKKVVRPSLSMTGKDGNGNEWYSLVLQFTLDDGSIDVDANRNCPLSLSVFGYQVCTEVYWFSNKANRDKMVEFFEKQQNKAFGNAKPLGERKKNIDGWAVDPMLVCW